MWDKTIKHRVSYCTYTLPMQCHDLFLLSLCSLIHSFITIYIFMALGVINSIHKVCLILMLCVILICTRLLSGDKLISILFYQARTVNGFHSHSCRIFVSVFSLSNFSSLICYILKVNLLKRLEMVLLKLVDLAV
jgi:hypothetical protein